MSPEFIKTPLRDLHRFGLDGMLQAYSENLKRLQNRSPSSLHGKQHKLTKSQRVVLYFYNASLGQYKKCRSPSYRLWLWKYVASEPRSGDSPVRIMGAWPILAIHVHQVHLQIRPGAMLPSFRSVRRLLQTKGPSSSRLNASTVRIRRIRFWVLSTVRRLLLFTANGCTEKPKLA